MPVHGTTGRQEQQTLPPIRLCSRTFQGLLAGREQQTLQPTPLRPQYLPRDYGPDGPPADYAGVYCGVKDRTWVYNEIGVNECARLYSAMNAEIVVGCSCLLLSCSRVKQVQKRRPRTVELTQ